ncbi:MAG: hypothetical protein R3B72_01345 [Polyangiaceae bacterium]
MRTDTLSRIEAALDAASRATTAPTYAEALGLLQVSRAGLIGTGATPAHWATIHTAEREVGRRWAGRAAA